MKTFSYLWQYLPYFFLPWEIFQMKVVEEIKIQDSFSCRVWGNVEKRGGAREAADDSMAHARCVLDKQGYTPSHIHARAQKYVILIAFPRQQ
jgi:hypothetical protein